MKKLFRRKLPKSLSRNYCTSPRIWII